MPNWKKFMCLVVACLVVVVLDVRFKSEMIIKI